MATAGDAETGSMGLLADDHHGCDPPPYESLATISFPSPTASCSSAITRTLPSVTALIAATEALQRLA